MPLLIHRAVNIQIVATMKIISSMNIVGASGVCVTFPWPTSDGSHGCGGQVHVG